MLFAVCVVLFMGTRIANADSLSIAGGLDISGTAGSQVFTFTNPFVTGSNPADIPIIGTLATLSSATLVSATGTQFMPSSGTFSVNPACDAVGCISGDVDWLSIVYGGTAGAFSMRLDLSNIGGTPGTDAAINDFLSTGQGSGVLTLNFTAGDFTSVSQLLGYGTPLTGGSFSASLTTPEPATLGLLGVGLLGLGLIGLSRRKRSEA